ncbi:tRNA (adenosine(37)-N6)-threonylcarbamoyltransferase complex ATPase subunit type 1 TsaE [Guyparkeria sp. SB14A]|uniref:tRNA (adenosine(37)-N6)-threonylcarbamoyltransferase complex ATPase subunit type 1 TsaE n=1 Tax=Guyparkeria sp. SB14A TaxID=2571147 RepID=UPI0010AC2C0A|nr:tRNA (adenosine(37)-N6)-threonylcarbamoyltransferase complex ATPase subunit type 1 TsaE [Guyparkeria sp. SB14A]TKA90650.1 tRNA (adenosine(37)-N6)-threonylcarbamoyltransferase complex ATPase subunit type 1 TsaE [Guyparkeria sp. SB14A]
MAEQRHHALDQAAVEAFAARLAAVAPAAGLLSLRGELGAGKSTFARAFLRALGVSGTIRSPTYTLVEPYDVTAPPGGPDRVLHLDLYRLADPEELDYLGVRDEADQALFLVEWLSQAAGELEADLELSLSGEASRPDRRDLVCRAATPLGEAWLARLAAD